ncbi:MAG: chemotaxis protein, partial [Deltaproteobacteria bacterium]|nr:chemotaxis protein [Deltaproteobacteria bacterium]
MKLIWKLAIPQICIVVCLGLISFGVINSCFNDMHEQYVRNAVENRFQSITERIEDSSKRAVDEASLFVDMPTVRKAYEIALSGDIDDPYSPQSQQARELLRKELAPILAGHRSITGKKLQLHFHLPNGRSLVRLWRDKNAAVDGVDVDISDDISAFRPTVMDANKTGKVTRGIESGLGGFFVRGVVPVIAPDGRHLGSAEVLQGFDPILDSLTAKGIFSFALYANVGLLEYAAELQDREKYPLAGNFVRIVGAKDPSVEPLITPALLEKGKNGTSYEDHGRMNLAAFPLNDYRGNQAGVIVLALDTQDIAEVEQTAVLVMAFMLVGMIVAPTCMLLLQLRLLATRPLNRINDMIQDITEERADLTAQIPANQKDEIG